MQAAHTVEPFIAGLLILPIGVGGVIPNRRAVVALGRVAQRACDLAGIAAIDVPSPSPLAVAEPGLRANTKSQRWIEVREGLEQAAALASR